MTDDPYADFKDDGVPKNLMNVLMQLADELVEAERIAEEKKEELRLAEVKVSEIKNNRIPDAAEGLKGKFKLDDGRELEINETIRASIAGDKRVPAINWLDGNDYGHIVKRELVIAFDRKDEEGLRKFKELIASSDNPLNMKENYSVHPQTLMAFVREKMGEGVNLPKDVFGIFRQREAKVKS
jgi:hypothetical protein